MYALHYLVIQALKYTGSLAYLSALPGLGWAAVIPLGAIIAVVLSVGMLEKPFSLLSELIKR